MNPPFFYSDLFREKYLSNSLISKNQLLQRLILQLRKKEKNELIFASLQIIIIFSIYPWGVYGERDEKEEKPKL